MIEWYRVKFETWWKTKLVLSLLARAVFFYVVLSTDIDFVGIADDTWTKIAIVTAGALYWSFITFFSLKEQRSITPIAIGFIEDKILFDRSLFFFGKQVETVSQYDLRRLTLLSATKTKSGWFKRWVIGIRIDNGVQGSSVQFDYQDRIGKFLFRPVTVDPRIENFVELIHRVADLKGVAFRFGRENTTKEELLEAFTQDQSEDIPQLT